MFFSSSSFKEFCEKLSLMIAIFAIIASFLYLLSCDAGGGDDDDDDDDDNNDSDDDDDDVSDEDKAEIACRKINECGFTDDLGINDCEDYAGGLSDWLMQCVMSANGCGDLAECFNISEGQ